MRDESEFPRTPGIFYFSTSIHNSTFRYFVVKINSVRNSITKLMKKYINIQEFFIKIWRRHFCYWNSSAGTWGFLKKLNHEEETNEIKMKKINLIEWKQFLEDYCKIHFPAKPAPRLMIFASANIQLNWLEFCRMLTTGLQ